MELGPEVKVQVTYISSSAAIMCRCGSRCQSIHGVRRTLARSPGVGWEIRREGGSGQIRESLKEKDFGLCPIGSKSCSKILSRGVVRPKRGFRKMHLEILCKPGLGTVDLGHQIGLSYNENKYLPVGRDLQFDGLITSQDPLYHTSTRWSAGDT